MPVRYHISPELNIVLYICEGLTTGSEYFDAAETASHDALRQWGMVTIVDLFAAEVDFHLQDLRRVVEFTDSLAQRGLEPEPVIALTHSKGILLAGEALKLFPSKLPVKFDVLDTVDDLIDAYGYAGHRQEFLSFYNECKQKKN